MQTIEHTIENTIKRIMRDKGITQEDCAEKLGFTQVGVCKMLQKRNSIRYEMLLKFADIFNMQVTDIINYSNSDYEGCPKCKEKDATIYNLTSYIERLEKPNKL